jgi:uncharacterized protein YcbK (DUF882 family)
MKDPEQKVSQWFKRKEIWCRCGCGKDDISPVLLDIIDRTRGCKGTPVIINSACRCQDHNKAVGGSPTSSHLTGLAVDIGCSSSRERYALLEILVPMREIKRIGIAKSFIHIDIDKTKTRNVIWVY